MPLIFSSCGCRRRIMSEALVLRTSSGFQINLDSAGIVGGVGAVNSNKGRKTIDRGVLKNHVGQLLLLGGHCVERNILRRFRKYP